MSQFDAAISANSNFPFVVQKITQSICTNLWLLLNFSFLAKKNIVLLRYFLLPKYVLFHSVGQQIADLLFNLTMLFHKNYRLHITIPHQYS